jgi:hypothetical protein
MYILHPLVEGFLRYDDFVAHSTIATWTVHFISLFLYTPYLAQGLRGSTLLDVGGVFIRK